MPENYTEIHLTLPSRFTYNRPFNWLIKGVGCFEKDERHLLIIKQSLINSHWDAHYSPLSALSVLLLMFLGSNQTLTHVLVSSDLCQFTAGCTFGQSVAALVKRPAENWVRHCCFLKGTVHPENKNPVIIYSPSTCSKPIRVSIFCWTQKRMWVT